MVLIHTFHTFLPQSRFIHSSNVSAVHPSIQLEAALNSSPRVLNILQSFTEQDEPILRDTIRFRRGLALLNENIEILPEGKIKDDLKLVWSQLADVTYPTRMTSVFCTRGG